MSKKFLIGQLACFGDCLYATTIARQIRADHPDSHVTWAVLPKYKSILELNPDIDSIWEFPVPNGDYYDVGWRLFKDEAIRRKKAGEFDEIIFSQISPMNWDRFFGTIRGTIIHTYTKTFTVPVAPVVVLSSAEVDKVKSYADENQLERFRHVVLVECSPGSGQSDVNLEYSIELARKITAVRKDVCFILSSKNKLPFTDAQIIDASVLSYRENAELTKYCTLLIGCSSGVTWLTTSTWAKPLPMLQLLNESLGYFAGVHFDFEINKLNTSGVIEMTKFDMQRVEDCVTGMLSEKFSDVKARFHQSYKPEVKHLYYVAEILVNMNYRTKDILKFARQFVAENAAVNNPVTVNYAWFLKWLSMARYRKSDRMLVRMVRAVVNLRHRFTGKLTKQPG